MSEKGPYRIRQSGNRLLVEGPDGHRMSTHYVEDQAKAQFHLDSLNEAHAAGREEMKAECVKWLRQMEQAEIARMACPRCCKSLANELEASP